MGDSTNASKMTATNSELIADAEIINLQS